MPATATTDLADTTGLALDASVEDEFTASWDDVTDYGNYRVQHRESGTSTWVDDGTVPQSDTNTVISNLLDGEKYDVRVRAETEHVASAWLQLSEVTKLPAPGTPSVTGTTISSIDIQWADNADNENGQDVELREEKDNRHDTGFEPWTVDADRAPDTTTHTFSDLKSNWKYEFRITAYTEHVTATSSTTVQTTAIDYQDGFTLELRQDGDKLAFKQDVIRGVQLPNRHSVINEWTVELPEAAGLEDWTYAEAFIWYENARHDIAHQLLYRGEFEVPETTESRGTTIVRGKDTTRKLKRGGANVTYSNIPYWEAIQDYFQNHLPDWTATVNQPTPRTIAADKVVQDTSATGTSMADIFSPAATEPFHVQNGELKSSQTAYVLEGENNTGGTHQGNGSQGRYSGGKAASLDSTSDDPSYDFTTTHAIPEANVGVYVRWASEPANSSDMPIVAVKLDGTKVGEQPGGGTNAIQWDDFNGRFDSGWAGGDLAVGTHTITLDVTTAGTDFWMADVVCLVDTRYHDVNTLDNDNGGSGGYLDDPALFTADSTLSASHSETYNIEDATITATLNDTSGTQALEASNDSGKTYLPSDGTESNTQSTTATFAGTTWGTNVHARVSLDGFGSRTTATPQKDFKGQAISSWKLDITTNDLSVIDKSTFTGSHYKNVQSMCRDSGMRFVVGYAENSFPIDVFETGDITKTASWTTLDHTRTTPDDEYANSVTAWGATDDQGNRLKAVAKDDDAIAADGEEIEAEPIFRPEMDSTDDLKSLVRTRLAQLLENDDLTGDVTIIPKYIQPGYSYSVSELDDKTLPLESVEFSIGVDGDSGTLDFAGDTDLVSQLTGISTEVSSVKDAF